MAQVRQGLFAEATFGGGGGSFLSGIFFGYFKAAFFLSAARTVAALAFAAGFAAGFLARPIAIFAPVFDLANNF